MSDLTQFPIEFEFNLKHHYTGYIKVDLKDEIYFTLNPVYQPQLIQEHSVGTQNFNNVDSKIKITDKTSNALTFPAFLLLESQPDVPALQKALRLSSFTLNRNKLNYSGFLNSSTSSGTLMIEESNNFHMTIKDGDRDEDGVPNIIDNSENNEVETFISFSPFVFGSNFKGWYKSNIHSFFYIHIPDLPPSSILNLLQSQNFSLWIYNPSLGWIYKDMTNYTRNGQKGFSTWIFINSSWVYTDSFMFPYFFNEKMGWLYFDETRIKKFYQYDSKTWVEIGN